MDNITLEDGEIVCDKCRGDNSWSCTKCFGYGKLDWIENIIGKSESLLRVSFSNDGEFTTLDGALQVWMSKMADHLAKEIDKQILDGIKGNKFFWET